MLSVSQVCTMIELCRQTFGNPSILDAQAPVLEQVILFPAETPKNHQSLEAWQQAFKMREMTGPTLTAPFRLGWRDTTASRQQWRDVVNLVESTPLPTFLPAPAVSVSPEYGPTGRPSPGRLVRLRLPGGDIPAVVHRVLDETGSCILTYTDVPAVFERAMRDPIYVCQRAVHASFGHEPESGQWDYWPRV